MTAQRAASAKEKSVAVRVVKTRARNPRPVQHLMPAPADPRRERLLWRSVGIASIVILIIAGITIWSNLSKPTTSDSFWSGLSNRVAQVGNNFTDFWRQIVGSKTVRPEDRYKKLEQKVFPPLPTAAQE